MVSLSNQSIWKSWKLFASEKSVLACYLPSHCSTVVTVASVASFMKQAKKRGPKELKAAYYLLGLVKINQYGKSSPLNKIVENMSDYSAPVNSMR